MDAGKDFDVIVVGGGHAGTEAASAAARAGMKTLLLTHSLDTLGQMSCNPSIGGIGKGHLTREVDALDGLMARGADRCGIHFRRLNASKGPAVRATRAQIDRVLYRAFIRSELESTPNLQLFQQPVDDLIVDAGCIIGVRTQLGIAFHARAVVLTVGTFLSGRIHVGERNHEGGRAGDPPANTLGARLRELAPRVGRLKTGTPPRIAGDTIDYAVLEAQPGDTPVPVFSFLGDASEHPDQVECHIARTNARTHDIIREGLDRSPMYSGKIESTGPRYCPSIEDKIVRFADKDSHQIFVEPEGLQTTEVYPNGISTSLPYDVQIDLVRSIRGFENAHLTRPGYAIEYDYFDPRDLQPWLETKQIEGLFFAGQINGTTGYEEAAAQGILAGINAARRASGEGPWWPSRSDAYIGVLVDDLITLGTNEPYRMFTSRAEFRLLLREDNADLRLTEIGRDLGVVSEQRYRKLVDKREAIEREQSRLRSLLIRPNPDRQDTEQEALGQALKHETSALELLKRPNVTHTAVGLLVDEWPRDLAPDVIEQVEIQARYDGYIQRQQREIDRLSRHDETILPADIDFDRVRGLSAEVRQKLKEHRPHNLGQAARISGVTPAAISLLLVYVKRGSARESGSLDATGS